jgi:cation transport ATPase
MNNSATGKVILQIEGLHCDVVAIPLAVSGLQHPVITEIAMASSSVTVVSNANLLKRLRL